MKKLACAIGAVLLAVGAAAQTTSQIVPQFGLDKAGTGCRRVTIYDANKPAADKTTPIGCVDPVAGFLPVIPSASVLNSQLAPVASGTFKGRVSAGSGLPEDLTAAQTRSALAIDQVTNTSDAAKPISTATQAALDQKTTVAQAAAAAPVQSVAGRAGAIALTSSDVGLGNVENKSSATILSGLSSYSGNIATTGTVSSGVLVQAHVRATAAGSPLTIPATSWFAMVQTGTVDSQTLIMPVAPSDGMMLRISTVGQVTALTLTGASGQTVNGWITASQMAANTSATFMWDASSSSWQRMQ